MPAISNFSLFLFDQFFSRSAVDISSKITKFMSLELNPTSSLNLTHYADLKKIIITNKNETNFFICKTSVL